MKLQKGFTLVELLVVITVIGVLIALAVPNVTKLKIKAKETKVMAGVHTIQAALETFASNHDGLYPGLAVPASDDIDGVDPFRTNSGYLSMRALIGGGAVKPENPNLDFLDGFYFRPDPGPPPVPPFQVPDRLISDGALDIYPENPFRTNITGVTDQAIPMMNIFGIEFLSLPNPGDPDYFQGNPAPVRLCEPLWFGADGDATTITPRGQYDFPVMGPDVRYRGDYRNGLRYDPDADWKITRAEIQQTGFPEGYFAYIPLDPVQTDPTAPDFMRYCRNYWIIVYGSSETALRNKYKDVLPSFPRPLGTGIQHTSPLDYDISSGSPNTATAFEITVKQALVGAMAVIGTKYTEQFRVEGS